MIIPLIFVLRRSLQETDAFYNVRTVPTPGKFSPLSSKRRPDRCGYAAGSDDHHDVLLYYRLHPNLRQGRTPPERAR